MYIYIDFTALHLKKIELNKNVNEIQHTRNKLRYILSNLSLETRSKYNIEYRLKNLNNKLYEVEKKLKSINEFLSFSEQKYRNNEDYILKRSRTFNELSKVTVGGAVIKSKKYNNDYLKAQLGAVGAVVASGIVGSSLPIIGTMGAVTQLGTIFGSGPSAMQSLSSFNESLGNLLDFIDNGKVIPDALKSKVSIVQRGDYFIIKGDINIRKNLFEISGTRYKIGSDKFNASKLSYYTPSGSSFSTNWDKFKSNWKPSLGKEFEGGLGKLTKDSFAFTKDKGFLGNMGTALGYAGIGLDVIDGISQNAQNGATGTKIVADAAVDVGLGLGEMAVATGCAKVGAAIGSAIPIPVVGTVVGALGGFALGCAGSWLYEQVTEKWEINGKTVSEWTSEGIEYGLNKLKDGVKSIGNGVKKVGEGIMNTFSSIKNKLTESKSNVGSAVNSHSKAAFVS